MLKSHTFALSLIGVAARSKNTGQAYDSTAVTNSSTNTYNSSHSNQTAPAPRSATGGREEQQWQRGQALLIPRSRSLTPSGDELPAWATAQQD